MVWWGIGLIDQKSTPSLPVLGYSDTSTVKLDFDDVSFRIVKCWSFRATKWFKLGGFTILKFSKNHYHVIFVRPVFWKKNIQVMAWVALESRNQKLKDYLVMQCIKESSTLRLSPKGEKPSPRIVFWQGMQNEKTKCFLITRRYIKNCSKQIAKSLSLNT